MSYNPQIHNRRGLRLKGYDYSKEGLYFITICVQDKLCLFGKIVDGQMVLNDAGQMVEKWYFELEKKFPDIKCHEMVVMPNHFHCIVEIVGNVGADLRVGPEPGVDNVGADLCVGPGLGPDNVGADLRVGPGPGNVGADLCVGPGLGPDNVGADLCVGPVTGGQPRGVEGEGGHIGPPLLFHMAQWFKTMTTNEYIRGVKNLGWLPFNRKLWQRDYWEHIIRNEQAYNNISQYIINNPKNWGTDKLS